MVESEIYQWLADKQFPVAEHKVFESNENIDVDFFPAALKIQSPAIVHKTDVGGVVVDIQDAGGLAKARRQIIENLRRHDIFIQPGDRFIVSRMYSGIELFFGVIDDPVFERVVVFGAGGIYTELFKDVCFIDSEADRYEITRAILQTKISVIFTRGFRGKKYNMLPVIELIEKLQKLDVQELDLNPVIMEAEKLTIVDARLAKRTQLLVHKPVKNVPGLFKPQSIAIIGASSHEGKVGYAIAKNTANNANVLYVNPAIHYLFGKQVYQSIEALPAVDTAVLAIAAPAIKSAITDLAVKGVKNIIIITAGFKEAGHDEKFLTELATEFNLNIIGPNCLGAYLNGINLTFVASDVLAGKVNLLSQSGAILSELMDKATARKIGFENVISVGNMADVDFGDLVNSYTGNNPLNLYIEGITNGKNLLRAIRKAQCTVRVYKAGQTEAAGRAAFSHTGNMTGNYQVFCGLLKSAGAQMVTDINGLLYSYNFNKILVVTNAGGAGTVMSDLISDKLYQLSAEQKDLLSEVLPQNWSKNNPVDIIGDAGPDRFNSVLQIADDFSADVIYVIVTPQFMTDAYAICKAIANTAFKTRIIPVLLGGVAMQAAKNYLLEQNILFFEELNEAVSFL